MAKILTARSNSQAAPKAVVLLSGGIDSTTTLAIARDEGYEVYAMSFRYGQRHKVELACAENIARAFGVKQHNVIDIDLRIFGASALTADIAVPKDRSDTEMEEGIPITYVPARNTIFLSYALAWAEVLNADTIFIGSMLSTIAVIRIVGRSTYTPIKRWRTLRHKRVLKEKRT